MPMTSDDPRSVRIPEASGSASTLQHGLWGRGGQHGAVDQVCSEGLEGDVVRSAKAVPGLVRHVGPRDVTWCDQWPGRDFAIFHGFHGPFCGKMMRASQTQKNQWVYGILMHFFRQPTRWGLYEKNSQAISPLGLQLLNWHVSERLPWFPYGILPIAGAQGCASVSRASWLRLTIWDPFEIQHFGKACSNVFNLARVHWHIGLKQLSSVQLAGWHWFVCKAGDLVRLWMHLLSCV